MRKMPNLPPPPHEMVPPYPLSHPLTPKSHRRSLPSHPVLRQPLPTDSHFPSPPHHPRDDWYRRRSGTPHLLPNGAFPAHYYTPSPIPPPVSVINNPSTNAPANNNIIVNVPPPPPDSKGWAMQNTRNWSSGLCACCSDCSSCCCVLWFLPCVMCKMAIRMGENCCVPFLPGALLAMRTKLRTMYGIKGSICCDCCELTYCTYCAICQMDRELTSVGL